MATLNKTNWLIKLRDDILKRGTLYPIAGGDAMHVSDYFKGAESQTRTYDNIHYGVEITNDGSEEISFAVNTFPKKVVVKPGEVIRLNFINGFTTISITAKNAYRCFVVGGPVEISGVIPYGALVFDSFDRPDNATSLGVSDTGQTPDTVLGTWGIKNEQAYSSVIGTGTNSYVIWDAGKSDNILVSVKLSAFGTGGIMRLVARFVDINNRMGVAGSSGKYAIYRTVSGVAVAIAVSEKSITAGDTVALKIIGDQYTLIINGVNDVSATDSSFIDSTKCGLSVGSGYANISFDDFTVMDIS